MIAFGSKALLLQKFGHPFSGAARGAVDDRSGNPACRQMAFQDIEDVGHFGGLLGWQHRKAQVRTRGSAVKQS